ncbi:MAG: hypothetical protein U1F25_11965 [Rubrivivax sp.]
MPAETTTRSDESARISSRTSREAKALIERAAALDGYDGVGVHAAERGELRSVR